MSKLSVKLRDVTVGVEGRTKVRVSTEKDKLGLLIHPKGMGTWDGNFAPILLEQLDGVVRLIVWGDINKEDPTHIIDLSGALESARKEEEETDKVNKL